MRWARAPMMAGPRTDERSRRAPASTTTRPSIRESISSPSTLLSTVSSTSRLAARMSSSRPVSFHHPLTTWGSTRAPPSSRCWIASVISSSPRGELEITDAIQHLLDGGARVEPHVVKGWWKDTGRLEDILAANRLVLETVDSSVEGELIDSRIDGRVVVEAGARLERSSVRGPAIIGARAHLIDCYVGPY